MKCCNNSSRSRPYYFRRCKQNISSISTTSTIDSLPYDLLFFNILLRLSAQDIYSNAMLVCREWYNAIRTHDFVQAHLQHSTPGILVKNFCEPNIHLSFVSIRHGGRVEVSKSDNHRMLEQDGNWDSCNGLILQDSVMRRGQQQQPCLFNPATKQVFQIPDHLLDTKSKTHCMSIGCCSRSSVYKVVVIYWETTYTGREMLLCAIVTVGVDKSWRLVCTEHLSPASKALLCHGISFTAQGFIHYVCVYNFHAHSHNHYVMTFNVETETFTEYPIPQGLEQYYKYYLSTGTSLSLFATGNGYCYKVWDMKSETGEWTKIADFDLRPHICKLKELCPGYTQAALPVGWFKDQEVVPLRFHQPARFHIAYNLRTHEIDWFELDASTFDCYESIAHTSSLVGLA